MTFWSLFVTFSHPFVHLLSLLTVSREPATTPAEKKTAENSVIFRCFPLFPAFLIPSRAGLKWRKVRKTVIYSLFSVIIDVFSVFPCTFLDSGDD